MLKKIGLLLAVLFALNTPARAIFPRGGTPAQPPPTLIGGAAGPSLALYQTPPYGCATNYFVSTTGSDSNNGLSLGAAWATLAHANSAAVGPGSCINIVAGVYGQTASLTITNGGNQASKLGYLVYRCLSVPYTFSGGVLQSEGTGCVVKATSALSGLVPVTTSYVIFDAIEFDGNSATASAECLSQYSASTSTPPSNHHIWVINSDMHNCGGNGYALGGEDWPFVIHNVSHANATTNAYQGSGISIYEPVGLPSYTPTPDDTLWCASVCFHGAVAYNVSFINFDPQTGSTTDGNGIILDDFNHTQHACPITGVCPYAAPFLVMGNLVFNNGGRGINVFSSGLAANQLWLVNNNSYTNGWDTHNTTAKAEIGISASVGIVAINNITYETLGISTYYSDGGASSWNNNLAYPSGHVSISGSTYPTVGANPNLDGSDPLFTSLTPGGNPQNFALQGGSPARSFGQGFAPWQQHSPVDSGGCPSTLTACP